MLEKFRANVLKKIVLYGFDFALDSNFLYHYYMLNFNYLFLIDLYRTPLMEEFLISL